MSVWIWIAIAWVVVGFVICHLLHTGLGEWNENEILPRKKLTDRFRGFVGMSPKTKAAGGCDDSESANQVRDAP